MKALGSDIVWAALKSSGHFTRNELSNCAASGSDGAHTEDDVVAFCGRNHTYKVKAALSVLSVFTEESARRVSSIESLLSEIAK
ncbi:hypothetical protein [Propionibacterium freudenreichii]|uniref:hypothetical protein n=1 Tax=Propionibacterium freudenreichii TaxID=1744 RepID=UPI0021A7C8A9|nr:hypothetical protein [Propionibacterium freudenreichii]MCT2985397.1 hypothetical protein [Propionibacterium freudenreichii]